MQRYEEALETFIEKMEYLSNPDVLGIVFSGSFLTGYNKKNSDIDVHVIMSNYIEDLHRGVTTVNGFEVEYFEKPIHDLYESADNEFLTQSNALLPIIGHGKILFDRNGEVKRLQEYILDKYIEPMPPLDKDDAIEMAAIIHNRMKALKSMKEQRNWEFTYNYYLIVEKIRKFYFKLCGCPDVPVTKVRRLYADPIYREAFCKSKMPEDQFFKLHFKAVKKIRRNAKKLVMAQRLYEYTTRDLNFNPGEYRVKIKSRNNPLNKIHE